MDSPCYSLKEYHFDDPIFNDIEATYIIHLEGNGRYEDIEKQLQTYHPTKLVYLVLNKGFKKCEKDKRIDKSYLDLIDAFFTIFKDANEKQYENILVLEDDFTFDEKILDKTHATSIESFLKEKQGNLFAYYLGTLPILQMTLNTAHNRVFCSGGTHACIYPQTFIKHMVENVKQETVLDWDNYMNEKHTRYKYHTPLCYQLFPQTENKIHWGHESLISSIIFHYIREINIIALLKLDTNIHPGYDIFEFASKFIFWFIVITLIIMNVCGNYFTYKNFKWLKKNWHYFIYMFIGNNILYPISILCIFAFVVYIQTLLYV
jgi:hypothetical protein